MDTKIKADVAESAVTTELLKRGFRVLKPVGDRLPYDLALDCNGRLLRIQVKHAWYDQNGDCYIVDARQTKTNRRVMLRKRYNTQDFDFAILYVDDRNVFYVLPVDVFTSYGSTISLVENRKRQRKPKSAIYRNRWDLLSQWAHQSEMIDGHLSNSVKPDIQSEQSDCNKVIPSQALSNGKLMEGVETRRQAPETAIAEG